MKNNEPKLIEKEKIVAEKIKILLHICVEIYLIGVFIFVPIILNLKK